MAAGRKTGGRRKGTPNKVTAQVKDMVMSALQKAGGEDYLIAQAHDNPTAFMTLVGKVMPIQANVAHEGDVGMKVSGSLSWQPPQ